MTNSSPVNTAAAQLALAGPGERAFNALIQAVDHLAELDSHTEYAERLQLQIENFLGPLSDMLRELSTLLPGVSGAKVKNDIREAFAKAHAAQGMAILKGSQRQVSYASRLRRKIIAGVDN